MDIKYSSGPGTIAMDIDLAGHNFRGTTHKINKLGGFRDELTGSGAISGENEFHF